MLPNHVIGVRRACSGTGRMMHRMATEEAVGRAAEALGIDPATLRPAGGASGSAWAVGDRPLVLRVGASDRMRREAAAQEAAAGVVPVPRVLASADVDGASAVLLERVPGSTALDAARRDPVLAGRIGRACGRLHERLAAVAAPEGLEAVGPGGRLLHLDLHPMNVLVDDRGEVAAVLDWANAASGVAELDRARTWSVLALDPAARTLAIHAWWRDLVAGWRATGRLDDLSPTARAWACRFLLRDLASRHSPAALRPAQVALRDAEREIGPSS